VALPLRESGTLVSRASRPAVRAAIRVALEQRAHEFSCDRHGLRLGVRVFTLRDDDDDEAVLWAIYACCPALAERARQVIEDVRAQVSGPTPR
jgi:alkanesulfonate monooxygenase SsuD/methylene tetrahydromethanopterin reductase-like flavin-dependent oxidoreductase (luciferase family)